MLRIGIISAMEREVGGLVRDWCRRPFVHAGRRHLLCTSGTVHYVSSGIGREPGMRATEALIAQCQPDIVISAGLAGALTPNWRVGDTITPGTVIDTATDESFTAAFGKGTVVSSLEIAGAELKRQLARRYCADAVDMEGAVAARVARRHGIPFCALKTVSDELDFAFPPLNPFVTAEGEFDMKSFCRFIVFRPQHWRSVLRLGRNAKRATGELCRNLQHLISQLTAGEVNPPGNGRETRTPAGLPEGELRTS